MDFSWISPACDIVILVGAVLVAFDRIGKPFIKLKKKTDTSFEEKVADAMTKAMPDILKKHDEEVKEEFTKQVTANVIKAIQQQLTQVDLLKQQYDVLVLTAKDVLREKIMKIYNDFRRDRVLPIAKKEQLEQYYIDYKALKGNSYIDKYYNRMKQWEVVDDEDIEEDR